MGDVIYLDACVLDLKEQARHFLNSQNSAKIVTSHLAIGEAVANTGIKKGVEASKILLEFLIENVNQGKLSFVQHDDKLSAKDELLEEINEEFPRLSLTDSIHLATAVKNKCNKLISIDGDFTGIERRKLAKFGAKHEIQNLGIERI